MFLRTQYNTKFPFWLNGISVDKAHFGKYLKQEMYLTLMLLVANFPDTK